MYAYLCVHVYWLEEDEVPPSTLLSHCGNLFQVDVVRGHAQLFAWNRMLVLALAQLLLLPSSISAIVSDSQQWSKNTAL